MEQVKEQKSNKERLQNGLIALKFMYGYARKHMVSVIIYTFIGMSAALVGVLGSLVSRDLVDIITGHQTGALIKTFMLTIGIQLLMIAINNTSNYVSSRITLKVGNEIKADVYDQIMLTEWESLSNFHSGNIVARWMGDSASIAQGILNILPNAIIYLFRFATAFYMVIRYDWTFAAIAIATVPLSFMVSRTNLKRMQKASMSSIEFNAKMGSFTQESFSNVQNVKALDMVQIYCKRLRELQKEQVNVNMTLQKISIVNSIILTLVAQTITYVIYGWGIYKVWSGAISYGTMTMFLSLSQSLSGTTQSLIGLVPSSIGMLNAVARIRDIVELPKEDYSQSTQVKEFFEKHRNEGIGICIKDASFTYQSGTKVFDNADFKAFPREVVGLVGPSGEGKTTMLRLLLSIIHMSQGQGVICVGKDEYSKENMEITASTRQLCAYVPQGNSMFPGSIAVNMRMVKEDATDSEIEEALRLACAWDFVSKLPEGIHTELKERGGGLSEGQAQRLSIARALLRKTPILLLDEATSALDQGNANEVLNNIRKDTYPRTCIITTHRPEVMEICNRIYKINDTELKEK